MKMPSSNSKRSSGSTSAFTHTAPYAAVAFLVCAALSLVLPKTAVVGDYG